MSYFAVICVLRLGGESGQTLGEISNVAFGKEFMRLESGIHITEPVSPLMGSEAPCCGGGLWGNCVLIIHFIF